MTGMIIQIRRATIALFIALSGVAYSGAKDLSASGCEGTQQNFSEVLACYRKSQADLPLTYVHTSTIRADGIEKCSYELMSQSWPPDYSAAPEKWSHAVDIYIPDHALSNRALLTINNGTNHGSENNPAKGPTDFPENTLRTIAKKTRVIAISVSNVPNQYLKYQDDDAPKREDDSIAHSWKLFLNAPAKRPFLSLHIPMMEAAVKTMDLAESVLKPWNIHSFIVTGASKRAWMSWHVAIADSRVTAIVPFAIDVLNTKEIFEHTYQAYGKNWPIAFAPYYREGITDQQNTSNFEKLMKIEDPLRYLNSIYADRLTIPKFIVNASGDDFFTPDNARLYFDQLPGPKSLRVVPNSDHFGIKEYMEQALVSFTNRLQQSDSFPTLTSQLQQDAGKTTLLVQFSEPPVQITRWSVLNPVARDFRHACGIRYVATPLVPDAAQKLRISIEKPKAGWMALFVEARFKDGFIATTLVYILPDKTYPMTAPPDKGPACKTLPGK